MNPSAPNLPPILEPISWKKKKINEYVNGVVVQKTEKSLNMG